MRYLWILLFVSVSAFAHDAWFEPVTTSGVAQLRMKIGEPFLAEETMPFESARVAAVSIATHGATRDLRGDPLAMNGVLSVAAPAMINVERLPFDVALDAEHFNTYLEDEGHYDLLQARMRRRQYSSAERERVTRHIKTFVGNPSADANAFLHAFGSSLEIVPLALPVSGKPWPLKVMLGGKALSNARVSVFGRNQDGARWMKMIRTDGAGVASFVLESSGFIVVRAAHLAPCHRCDVDYASDWAALTFTIE